MAYNYDILIQKQMNRLLQQQYRGEKQRKASTTLTEALRKHGKEGFSKFNAQDRQRFVKDIESTYGKRELKRALGTDFGTYVNDLVTLTQGRFESKYQFKIKDKDFEAQEILSRGYERILTPRKYDRPGRPPLTEKEKAKRERQKEREKQKKKEKKEREKQKREQRKKEQDEKRKKDLEKGKKLRKIRLEGKEEEKKIKEERKRKRKEIEEKKKKLEDEKKKLDDDLERKKDDIEKEIKDLEKDIEKIENRPQPHPQKEDKDFTPSPPYIPEISKKEEDKPFEKNKDELEKTKKDIEDKKKKLDDLLDKLKKEADDKEKEFKEKAKELDEKIKEQEELRDDLDHPVPPIYTPDDLKVNPDDYKIDPDDFKPIHGPEEYERKPEDFIDPTEEFKPDEKPEEKEPELPKLEDLPLEDIVEPGKDPIEAQPLVIQTPDNEPDPDLDLEKAIGRRASKAKIATENWFRCARIEFGLNIARLPVLIDLATRVANKDPRLLFTPQTEIELWYRHYGYAKADVLIEDLEAVSGLKASTDIKGYEDIEDRNKKIRRWYAKRLRYNIREEMRDQFPQAELEKEVRKRMRELGYEY